VEGLLDHSVEMDKRIGIDSDQIEQFQTERTHKGSFGWGQVANK
jgi:hypothetical protein